jgi:hypothetical protein
VAKRDARSLAPDFQSDLAKACADETHTLTLYDCRAGKRNFRSPQAIGPIRPISRMGRMGRMRHMELILPTLPIWPAHSNPPAWWCRR